MDRYFEAQRAHDKLFREAAMSGDEAETLLKKARTILVGARAQVTLTEPLAAFDAAIGDHDLAVLGINNDRDEADAKFVAREMQLDYPVLRSRELPGRYGVQGFPTLIIIDRDGKVAHLHVGYSPHLFEELTAAVDRLLGRIP